ncbi:MAG: response regulator, partial [Thermodesulfobacteriota bacterium]
EALREGAFDVIHKPLDIDKVVSLIKKAVKSIMILVVDDDMNTCETLKDVLEEKKYGVVVAQRGEEAIERVREDGIDIVLIDVNMPVLNGLETYLAIKEINPEITAVMITGYREDMAALVDKAINNNAYICLYKPLDMDEVIAVINKICRA